MLLLLLWGRRLNGGSYAPLSKREPHAPPGCHRSPDREPLPPVSFRHDDQEHGTLRGVSLLVAKSPSGVSGVPPTAKATPRPLL